MGQTKKQDQPSWHALAAAAVLDAIGGSPSGLSDAEVIARRARYGPNELPRARPTSLAVIYLRQFASPLIYLLMAAAVISLALAKLTDAAFIFVVLQVNAVIGTIQEWRAETGIRGLDRMIQSWTIVMRNGVRQRQASEELVPGDIVHAEPGNKIGADIRLLESSELRVDESLLSGESYPVEKKAGASLPATIPLSDRVTMLYAGTTVVGGEGHGVVIATGRATEVGRIASSLATRRSDPPLILRLRRFMNFLTIAFTVVVAVMIVTEIARGAAPQDIFLVAIALAVSAVPEGLPIAVTVALAIGTRRMAARKVIVRRLAAVEGLGACTLIASDKTGTLTCNVLTATRVWIPPDDEYEISGAGHHAEGVARIGGQAPSPSQAKALSRLAMAATLASEGDFHVVAGDEPRFYGDSVDVALLVLAGKLGVEPDSARAQHPRANSVPFSSERRYAASFNIADGSTVAAHVKGATEVVLPMCTGIDFETVLAEERKLAEAGFRVLAVARGYPAAPIESLADGEKVLEGMHFLGLIGFSDPLRPEAKAAVARCRSAGIQVRMVTGDHPITALSVARELGLIAPGEPEPGIVVTGAEIARGADDPEALGRLCARARVFARVEPSQKLMIVKALQEQGHFVAVTGDGVNDAPALKSAEIGVAMGLSGTDVARDAADLVISDDRFSSIVSGIREGRIVYDNIRKVVNLLVATGAGEVILFILALATGLPLPLFAVQLLWLNLITNGIQDVALAFEKGEPDILDRPPRPTKQRIMDRNMLAHIALAGGFMGIVGFSFYSLALGQGMHVEEARNLLLTLMVLFENVYVFSCRSETRSAFTVPLSSNPLLALSVAAALGIHVGAMQVPLMQQVLGVKPIAPEHWILVGGMALGLLLVMEIYKFAVQLRFSRTNR